MAVVVLVAVAVVVVVVPDRCQGQPLCWEPGVAHSVVVVVVAADFLAVVVLDL